jgi:fatty acid desaturase
MGASEISVSVDESGSELRRHIRAESIKVPRELMTRSTLRSIGYVAYAHLWIGVALLVGRFMPGGPGAQLVAAFLPVLVAQRCFQTLVHHLSHDFLSRRRKINDTVGNFLLAGFIGMRIQNYRRVHFQHHVENGSERDPEYFGLDDVAAHGGLGRYAVFFILGGEALTLVKKYYFSNGTSSKLATRETSKGQPAERRSLVTKLSQMAHVVLAQLVLITLFTFVAKAWYLYFVWMYVAVTWSPLLSRLRFLVEHPGAGDRTVSTNAPTLQLLFFAPYQFNYHFEHHAWPGVPPYRLGGVHHFLAKDSFFDRHPEYRTDTFVRSLSRQSRALREASGATVGS